MADLTLLPLLSEDVADQRLLENFLFDQEMPETPCWEGEMVLCPEREEMCRSHTGSQQYQMTNLLQSLVRFVIFAL